MPFGIAGARPALGKVCHVDDTSDFLTLVKSESVRRRVNPGGRRKLLDALVCEASVWHPGRKICVCVPCVRVG